MNAYVVTEGYQSDESVKILGVFTDLEAAKNFTRETTVARVDESEWNGVFFEDLQDLTDDDFFRHGAGKIVFAYGERHGDYLAVEEVPLY